MFNLRTTDGTFFANGVLVHNCDAAASGFNALFEPVFAEEKYQDRRLAGR